MAAITPNTAATSDALTYAPTLGVAARKPRLSTLPVPRGDTPRGVIATGFVGAVNIMLGSFGGGAILVRDPILSNSPLAWLRFGHGAMLSTLAIYVGILLSIVAWIRLGRSVLAGTSTMRTVRLSIAAWTGPLLFASPLFSQDVYSYLAQGNLAIHGFDPYKVGPSVLPGPLSENVSTVWQNTPAPYGPMFMLLDKAVVTITGNNVLLGIIGLRLAMLPGLVLIAWAVPKIAVKLGGNPTVAVWLSAANPLLLLHLVGGPHNDIIMVGLLAAGLVLALDKRFAWAIVIITLAAGVKATAAIALPFVVWMWMRNANPDLVPNFRDRAFRWHFIRKSGAGVAIFAAVFAACTVAAHVDLGWISALSTSSAIVNYLSLPSGIAQFVHGILGVFFNPSLDVVLSICRDIGWIALVAFAAHQWWAARAGTADAIRRAAITFLIVCVFASATLPWYFTWPLVLGAGLAWSSTGLTVIAGLSTWLLLSTFPNGASALYEWTFVILGTAVSALAAWSLVRVDPLGLSTLDFERKLSTMLDTRV